MNELSIAGLASGWISMVARWLGGGSVCVILIWTVTVVQAADGPLTYFAEEAPLEVPKSNLPSSTDQIVVAKVRLIGPPASLLGIDQSGYPSREKPQEPLSAMLRVLDVVRGKRPEQELVGVTFGGGDLSNTYALRPGTPRQLAQEYFVAMYKDAFGFHLIGLPVSEARYREWRQEITEFERERLKSLPK